MAKATALRVLIMYTCLLLDPTTSAVLHPPQASYPVKITSAAYFRKHNHLIPYETTAKLFFRVSFPSINFTDPGICKPTDVLCHTEKATYQVGKDLQSYMNTVPMARPKRQIFVAAAGALAGFIAHTVLSRFSSTLFGTDRDAMARIKQYGDSLENKEFAFYQNFTHLYMNDIEQLQKRWWFVEDATIRNSRAHLHLWATQVLSTKIQFGVERCINNAIPTQFIPPEDFRKELRKLNAHVRSKGYFLSISPENVAEYLKLNTADCVITKQSAYIMVNIPLARSKWTINEMVPIAFAIHNQTCSLADPKNKILAVSEQGRMEIIDSSMSGMCDIVSDQLCFVPKYSKSPDICALNVYSNASFAEISKTCDFSCTKSDSLFLYSVERSVIVATNVKSLITDCNGAKTSYYPKENLGAVEIRLRCQCDYIANGEKLDKVGSCSELEDNNHTSLIIPQFWLENGKRTSSLSDLNVTAIRDKYEQLLKQIAPKQSTSGFGSTYHDIWLVATSSVLGFITVVVVVAVCVWFCK